MLWTPTTKVFSRTEVQHRFFEPTTETVMVNKASHFKKGFEHNRGHYIEGALTIGSPPDYDWTAWLRGQFCSQQKTASPFSDRERRVNARFNIFILPRL